MCHSVGGRGIAGGEEPTHPWMLRTRVDGVVRRWREGELAPTRSGYTSLAEERFRSCCPYGGRQSEILSPCSSSRWRGCAVRARGCGCCGAHAEKPPGEKVRRPPQMVGMVSSKKEHTRWTTVVFTVKSIHCLDKWWLPAGCEPSAGVDAGARSEGADSR